MAGRHPVASADDGKALASSRSALFVDTRHAMNFGQGQVPGAITAPYKKQSEKVEGFDASKNEFDIAKLPGRLCRMGWQGPAGRALRRAPR